MHPETRRKIASGVLGVERPLEHQEDVRRNSPERTFYNIKIEDTGDGYTIITIFPMRERITNMLRYMRGMGYDLVLSLNKVTFEGRSDCIEFWWEES